MSMWSYVTGTVDVDLPFACHNKDRAIAYVNWAINEITRRGTNITGSEGPCAIIPNMMKGHTMSSSESGNSFCHVLITFDGSLRDRECSFTEKEVRKFLWRLSHFVTLDKTNVLVKGDINSEAIIVNDVFERDFDVINQIGQYDTIERKDALKANQQYRIQAFNRFRFFDHYLTLEKCQEILEIFNNASVKTLECLMNNFGLPEVVDFEVSPERMDYLDELGMLQRATEDDMDSFFWKRIKPKKYTDEELYKMYEENVYNLNHEFKTSEQQDVDYSLFRLLRRIVKHVDI